jgi:hypothetical protein
MTTTTTTTRARTARTRRGRYLWCLAVANGTALISSDELGRATGVNATQVRRDLSSIARVGKRGVGYQTSALRELLGPIAENVILLGDSPLLDRLRADIEKHSKLLGPAIVHNLDDANVAIIDHADAEKAQHLASLAAGNGVFTIVNLTDHLLDVGNHGDHARVINASPLLTVVAAIAGEES